MRNNQEIGEAISQVVSAALVGLLVSQLTAEELEAFGNYVNLQEGAGFIFDPTAYRAAVENDDFKAVRRRLTLVRQLLALAEAENEHRPADFAALTDSVHVLLMGWRPGKEGIPEPTDPE